MKRLLERAFVLAALFCCVALMAPGGARAQEDEGEKLFNQVCVACHTINKGKLIGPDLANVHMRRPQEWIIRFVKSSQSVVKSGDPYAASLFEEFNKIPMPDNNFTDEQVLSIISYIAANSPGGAVDPGVSPEHAEVSLQPVTEENIHSGEALFVGKTRFTNGGPACSACHNIKYDGPMAGGALAKDLTDAHSRLSTAGVKAIMGNAPFPVMKQAFEGKALTDEEVFDVAAFLEYVDGKGPVARERNYGMRLLLSGTGGAIFLIGLFSGLWLRTKKRSVNHDIYQRQVKATWKPMHDSERIGRS